jgi:hypothetical protein
MAKIIINDKYTYECPFEVKVGDRLTLPSVRNHEGWVGTVTQIGSTYKGSIKTVLGFEDDREKIPLRQYRSLFDEWRPSCDSKEPLALSQEAK